MSRPSRFPTLERVTKHWRHALVCLHVVSSVAWMTGAAALAILLGLSRSDPAAASAAVAMAHHLDLYLLAVAANASATTGLVLAWTTPWGLVRHWWVATKAAITLGQLTAGIAVLSPVLDDLAAGAAPAPAALVAGTVAMAGAVAFQAFVSVAKPWGTTPLASRGRRPPRAGAPLVAAGVVAPAVDVGLTVVAGFPVPLLEVVVLVVVALARRRGLTGAGPAATVATAARPR